MNKRRFQHIVRRAKVYVGIGFALACFLAIALYVLANGITHLTPSFLFGGEKSGGLLPALVTTIAVILLTLLIAVPIGVGSAIYLVEYAKGNSPFVRLIRLTTETLTGIPSILYGLFGFLFFVIALGWSWSLLAGVCTLSIMVLPGIERTSEEALIAIPQGLRENSYALGVGKLRTILRVLLPSALPGVLAAVILSIGRIVGESAALILTAGTVLGMPSGLFQSAATLSVYMYSLASEGLDFGKAFATAIVLLVTVFLINQAASGIVKRIQR